MSVIKYGFWAIVAVCLVVVGLANRGEVILKTLPDWLAGILNVSADVSLPLFIVIFLGFGAGLLVGFLWEWVREFRIRSDARSKTKEMERMRRELASLKAETGASDTGDDVLALLNQPAR